MLNDRLKAAHTVAPALFSSENGLDEALQKSLGLISALLTARSEAKLAATVGAEAVDEAGALMTSLLQARRHQIACHRHLAETKVQIGLGNVMVGGGGQKPDQFVSNDQLNRVA